MVRGLGIALALALLPAAAASAAAAVETSVKAVERAIESGRWEQARLMIADLVRAGAGEEILAPLMADLAFAAGENDRASALYRSLLARAPGNRLWCERAMIAALKLGKVEDAREVAACATGGEHRSWRAWNASGVLADLAGDWESAEASYRSALEADGRNPVVLNNMGYSLLLRGDWAKSIDLFRQALDLDPTATRIANNLELATTALAENLPRRHSGESADDWAARLNDAGMAALILGDRQRATAAFAQALEASTTLYRRAANNLESIATR